MFRAQRRLGRIGGAPTPPCVLTAPPAHATPHPPTTSPRQGWSCAKRGSRVGRQRPEIGPPPAAPPPLPIPAICSCLPSCLYALPDLLRRELVVQTQEIAEIAGPSPGVTVPMIAEHLKAGTPITPVMVLFEWAGAHAATIKRHEATDHLNDVLSTAPGANAPRPGRDSASWLAIRGISRTARGQKRCTRRPYRSRNGHPLHILTGPGTTLPDRFTHRHHVPTFIHVHEGKPPSRLPVDTQGQANERTRPIRPQGILLRIKLNSKRLRIGQQPGSYQARRSRFSQVYPQMPTAPTGF